MEKKIIYQAHLVRYQHFARKKINNLQLKKYRQNLGIFTSIPIKAFPTMVPRSAKSQKKKGKNYTNLGVIVA